jgi:hypothetical protein
LGLFLCGRVDLATKTAGFERWDGMARRDRQRGNVTLLRRADVWVFSYIEVVACLLNLERGRKGEEREEHSGCCDTFHFEKEVLMGLRLCVLNRDGYIVRSISFFEKCTVSANADLFPFRSCRRILYRPGCSLHFNRISMSTSLSIRIS